MTDPALDRATNLDCASLSDVMDRLGTGGVCRGILPRDRGFRLVGRAFTGRYAPLDAAAPGTVGDYIDDLAQAKGLAGTVIDGACRDLAVCLELRYPLYSRSYSMRTGKDRVQFDATGEPVGIGGARVCAKPARRKITTNCRAGHD